MDLVNLSKFRVGHRRLVYLRTAAQFEGCDGFVLVGRWCNFGSDVATVGCGSG